MTLSFVFAYLFCLRTTPHISIIPLNCKITFISADSHNSPGCVRTGHMSPLCERITMMAQRLSDFNNSEV